MLHGAELFKEALRTWVWSSWRGSDAPLDGVNGGVIQTEPHNAHASNGAPLGTRADEHAQGVPVFRQDVKRAPIALGLQVSADFFELLRAGTELLHCEHRGFVIGWRAPFGP